MVAQACYPSPWEAEGKEALNPAWAIYQTVLNTLKTHFVCVCARAYLENKESGREQRTLQFFSSIRRRRFAFLVNNFKLEVNRLYF